MELRNLLNKESMEALHNLKVDMGVSFCHSCERDDVVVKQSIEDDGLICFECQVDFKDTEEDMSVAQDQFEDSLAAKGQLMHYLEAKLELPACEPPCTQSLCVCIP